MREKQLVTETELAALAKKYREENGKTRADAARDMGIKHPSIFHAEESPEKSYLKLRIRMIETYSSFKVKGPFYLLEKE
jgi:DNA-binding XRE family transcriptional regulator